MGLHLGNCTAHIERHNTTWNVHCGLSDSIAPIQNKQPTAKIQEVGHQYDNWHPWILCLFQAGQQIRISILYSLRISEGIRHAHKRYNPQNTLEPAQAWWFPNAIICDGSKEQTLGKSKKNLNEADIHANQIEPYSPWSNHAMQCIRDLKKASARAMRKTGTPKILWDGCI